ncbi:MAG: sigma-70 family RNA polymerase sigma factor, partial [Merdibacter sp.]|nr:sigma-70 family RNA polymerase sigma factor [Merdibacter sp.]
ASRCIENEILMYLRKNRNSFSDVSLNEPIANEKDGSEITLMDAIAAPEQRSVCEQIVLEERLKQLQAFLPLLDERELMIIEKRFGLHGRKEQTQKEIAQELGISRSYVSRIEKRAFLKLYRAFRRQEKNAVSR